MCGMATLVDQCKVGNPFMTKHLSDREARIAADFAAEVISELGLGRWQALVMEKPSPSNTIASITYVENRYVAQIFLCKRWSTQSSGDQYQALIHECLHLIHLRINHVLQDLESIVRPDQLGSAWVHYNREIEYMVDNLSTYVMQDKHLWNKWVELNEAKDPEDEVHQE